MLDKHPQSSLPQLTFRSSSPSCTNLQISCYKMCDLLPQWFSCRPLRSSTKSSLWSWKCLAPDQANSLVATLTKFVNLLATGLAPPSIFSHLAVTTLLASKKKKGRHQPIAVGGVLHRLVSKCLASVSQYAITRTFAPLQSLPASIGPS